MSLSVYRNFTVRDKRMVVVRRACRGRSSLVDWDTVPDGIKVEICNSHGDPKVLLRQNDLERLIEFHAEEHNEIVCYRLDNGESLKPEVMDAYSINAMILRACLRRVTVIRGQKKVLGASAVTAPWRSIAEEVARLNHDDYPHTLPKNERRLQAAAKRYGEEGWKSLIHKNYMNNYASKVADQAQEALLLSLIAYQNNLDRVQIAKEYNRHAVALGWDSISPSTVGVWRAKNELLIAAFRKGAQYFNNQMRMQVKRSLPTAPLYFWTLDGWTTEMLYQKTENLKGRSTTYHHRLVLEVVLDPCTMYPVGYAIGERENGELIRDALRNAVNHTRELFGARHLPHQLQSDNFGGKDIQDVYRSICRRVTPAQVGNAKAKVVEPYFKYLQKNYCQYVQNWSGFGTTSRKELQPNADAIIANKKAFPTKEKMISIITLMMEIERSTKRAAYLQAWDVMPQDKRLPMSKELYLETFGERTEPNRMTGQGLTPKIRGERTYYDCFDQSFRKHIKERWVCCYDPCDLSEVLAINTEQTIRYMMESKYIQPMALIERKEGDAEQLTRLLQHNEFMKQAILEGADHRQRLVTGIFEKNPELDTLSKMLLTDSKGQHKDRLADARESRSPEGTVKIDKVKPRKPKLANRINADATDVDYREMMMAEIDFKSFAE